MTDADYFFDLDSLSDEEFFSAYEPSDADIKYRSVTVAPQMGGEYLSAYHQQSNNYSMPLAGQNFKLNTFSKPTPTVSNSNRCPAAPFGISKTNFIINKSDYNTVTRSIAENLKVHENFDFSFIEQEHLVNFLLCYFSPLVVHEVTRMFCLCMFLVERQIPMWLKLF